MNTFLGSPLVMMVIILVIGLVPVWRIVRRTGHSGWWALLTFVPLANVIGLWILAFSRWPAVDRQSSST
jgi:hypothetical protein